MDEFHISAEQFREMKMARELLVKVTKEVAKQSKKILNAFFGTLETYQLYEMRHPKKKPRGSIRRKRREREKNRYSHTGSTLYIDDIYDIVSSKDNQ